MSTCDGTVMEEPKTLDERIAACRHCMESLKLAPMGALIDDVGDSANLAYDAWPDRLFLIDREGRVAFRSPPGPYGFEIGELGKAIAAELERQRGEKTTG
jgi:type I thyroxine 5'-deiodinase